jgi:DNA-binding beta-propeller fold protein YncE
MRERMKRPLGLFAILVFIAAAAAQARAAAGATIYLGTWPNKILVIDEAQGKIIDEIKLESGPPLDLIVSHDKKKLFVVTTKMTLEVVDLQTRKSISHFDLVGPGQRMFPLGAAIDPHGKYLYTTMRTATKEIDRFKLDKAKFAVIDVEQKKISKTFDFPKEFDSGFGFLAGYKVSPDGKLLYVFKEDILIFDLETFKQVDKIELSKPLYPGSFPISFRGGDDPNDEPGFVTAVFNATDTVIKRPIFGIARINLQTKAVDFTPIGPAAPMTGLELTPDRKTGYVVAYNGQGSTRRTEFWVFDVAERRLIRKMEFESRTRFNFAISGDGKKLYIYGAGPTIEIWDAATLKLEKTITLDGDAITQMLVLRPHS